MASTRMTTYRLDAFVRAIMQDVPQESPEARYARAMIQEVDYTLRDISHYEGSFTDMNVRCPGCRLAPGMPCKHIASACESRIRHFGEVEQYFQALFPHPGDLTRDELNSFATYFKNQYGTLPEVRALYDQTRFNALNRLSLMSLRDLHEWQDMRTKNKLKGNR